MKPLSFLLFISLIVVCLIQQVVVWESCQMYFLGHLIQFMLQFIYILAGLGRDEYTVVVESGHPCGAQVFERQILTLHRAEVVLVLGRVLERIYLVEHQYGRFGIATANIAQCLVDHFYLLLKVRMRYINHMHQDVGLAHLIER